MLYGHPQDGDRRAHLPGTDSVPYEKVVLKNEEIAVLEATGPYNIDVCQEVFGQFGVVFEE